MTVDPARLGGARLWPVVCLRSAGLPFDALAPLAAAELVQAVDAGADREAAERLLSDYWASLPRALASSPWAGSMLAALIWQNPSAAETTARPVLAGRYRPGSSKQRYKVATVVSYLQRYAAKNDTIGFFGPVAWGTVSPTPGRLTCEIEDTLIPESRVFLEDWAIHQIAAALTRSDPDSYRPVLAPHCRVDRDTLSLPMGGLLPLTEDEARILERCSGRSTVAEIAASTGLDASTVVLMLARYEERSLVGQVAQVDPPASGPGGHPLAALAGLRNTPAVDQAFESVGDAVRALAPVARDPARLGPALDRLHSLFSNLTGSGNLLAKGARTGRTVARVESRRGVRLTLGQDALRDLEAPMRVLVHLSRWLIHEAVTRTAHLLRESIQRIAGGDAGAAVVPLRDLWLTHADIWYATKPDHLASLIADAQDRWANCIGEGAPAARQMDLDPVAVLDRVQHLFPRAPGPPPPVEAYVCPDLMIDTSAGSPDGVPRYVLGELHLGKNTLGTSLFSDCAEVGPALDELWRADGGTTAAVSVSYLTAGRRMRSRFDRYVEVELAVSGQSPGLSRDAWRLADVDVLVRGATLIARHRRSGQELPLLALLSDAIAVGMSNLFRPFAPAAHQPRVNLGRLVIAREAWVLGAAELDRLRSASGPGRLVEMRVIARRHGMPRYLFATTAPGQKPLLVDQDSPASVDMFARHLRRQSGTCTLTEMLPEPAGLWLRDRDGRAYTSELRLALAL